MVDDYLKEEVRDEYLVTSDTKKLWKIQLDLLEKLQNVCEKNGIKMFVIWGTLLGAVRHKGFIPWDDDLDVGLLREDYDKLCEIAEQEFGYPYFFQTAENDRKFFIGYARLRNSETTGIIRENWSEEYNNGVYIDIYPLDGYSESKFKKSFQFLMRDYYTTLAISYYRESWPQSFVWKLITKAAKIYSKLYNYDTILKKHYKWCTKYNKNAKKVGLLYHHNLCKKYCFDIDAVRDTIKLPFETIEVNVPIGYHEILKDVYGDYMQFPPVEERGMWHDNQIIYDCDMPYKDYFATHSKK